MYDEDFDLDKFNEEFEKDSKTVLDDVYKEILELDKQVCEDAVLCAEHGLGKQLAADIEKIVGISGKLVELETFNTPIQGPNGRVYNIFGQNIKDEDITTDPISEVEASNKLKSILESVRKITMEDLKTKNDDETFETDDEISTDVDKYF